MKKLTRYALISALIVPLLALTGLWLCFDAQPRVVRGSELTPRDVARVRTMLQDADPRRAPPGVVLNFAASPRDLDVLLNDASRRLLHGAGRVDLQPGHADVEVSMATPNNPFGAWLNVHARIIETLQGPPELDALRLGRMPVPTWLASFVVQRVAAHYQLDLDLKAALSMIQRMSLTSEGLVVSYRWQHDFADRVRSVLIPPDLQERLKVYSDQLAAQVSTSRVPAGKPVALEVLLASLADAAKQRTVVFGSHDAPSAEAVRAFAAQDNRALLITLALYATAQPIARLVPAARDWDLPAERVVLIRGREDHPKHFLVSAVLAAEGGGRLADAIGVYKEVDDSRQGSGFSFDDLAADRAGTRVGQRAAHEPLALQARLANVMSASDVMPETADLPTFLSESEFRQRFGGTGSESYQRVARQIEARVAALAVLR